MKVLDLDNDTSDVYQTMTSLQRKLLTEIIKLKNEFLLEGFNATDLILGVRLFNFISDSSGFSYVSDMNNDETKYKIGHILGLNVYIDLDLPNDEIILTIDQQEIRDLKLDNILFDNNQREFNVKHIKVKSTLI